jgi:hypothetical protein
MFGTFKDADRFVDHCGFEDHREERLGEMIAFKDVQRS